MPQPNATSSEIQYTQSGRLQFGSIKFYKDLMDLEFVTEGVSEDDTFNVDQNNDDYSTFEGERCGICMDIVIDRGVLDCC
ncbi:hypothetical protein LOK49_LG13G00986 [Camellia lanceoleosa]|uniref:Uncharacterized protein n=1 Tax=Camellia lanceoleosa TaxID=1840588 RepID=A0ACC0FMG0_9ERIC|nr:hypothetical protein LOK49_LG13G00986 [Camellia lanceoleosa]